MSKFTTIILNEMSAVLSQIDERNTSKFVTEIRKAKRIYITGVGRSGLVVKAFGQRLMHLGFDVHLADEITAPAIARGDILIACSGTGTTMLPLEMARKAAIAKARVVSLTATPHSPLAKYSKLVITIPAPLEGAKGKGQRAKGLQNRQPARSLFEQALFIYLDSITLQLIDALHIRQSKIEKRHTNLE
ncbi:MAG: hypothetical protein A2W23_06150 [Planctomycetes bacterium RBG_16_43_13]|nr:MAG: hypothetical protein A2W23_06150 [Planctomycetes bacterium RBG_16_43_13]